MIGFQAAGFISKNKIEGHLSYRYRHLISYSDVWDRIIFSIISQFNTPEELESVSGNPEQTLVKVKELEEYIEPLLDLPFRRKMLVLYLWGYPEVFEVSNREFLPMFDEWLAALKAGRLDHRSWIFDEKAVTMVIDSLRAVKRGKVPSEGSLDLVPWTNVDLYRYHPRGKDVSFWRELLVEIDKRLRLKPEKRELCRHVSAVLEGGY
jgi:hypothetical protein